MISSSKMKRAVVIFYVFVGICFLLDYLQLRIPSVHKFYNINYTSGNPSLLPGVLFNLTNFRLMLNPENICSTNESTQLREELWIVTVPSSRNHWNHRSAIRETWATDKPENVSIKVVFLLGLNNPALNMTQEEVIEEDNRISEESLEFGDVVLGSFVDSYKNLSYKTLMGLKWSLEWCRNADILLKIDDDMFFDTRKFENYRKNDSSNLYCNPMHQTNPQRSSDSPWFLDYDYYELARLPNYCSGPTYMMSLDLAEKAFSVHQQAKFNVFEDVYITGFLMKEVSKVYNGSFEIRPKYLEEMNLDTDAFMPLCFNGTRAFPMSAEVSTSEENAMENMKCVWNLARLEEMGQENVNGTTSESPLSTVQEVQR